MSPNHLGITHKSPPKQIMCRADKHPDHHPRTASDTVNVALLAGVKWDGEGSDMNDCLANTWICDLRENKHPLHKLCERNMRIFN